MLARSTSVAVLAATVVAFSAYVYWDVARSGFSKGSGPAGIRVEVRGSHEAVTNATPSLVKPQVSIGNGAVQDQTTDEGDRQVLEDPTSKANSDAKRKALALRRGKQRSETLQLFFGSQARDGWAAETEIDLRRSEKPEGVSFDEVSCRANVCRIVASGPDKARVFDSLSSAGTAAGMKMFSRLISTDESIAVVESYLSPSGTKWPRPNFEDG